jgi:hypothetical protein
MMLNRVCCAHLKSNQDTSRDNGLRRKHRLPSPDLMHTPTYNICYYLSNSIIWNSGHNKVGQLSLPN